MSRSGGSSSNGRAARGGGDSRNECGLCAFGAQYCRSVTRSDGDVGLCLRLADFDEVRSKSTVQAWLSKHNFFADGHEVPCWRCFGQGGPRNAIWGMAAWAAAGRLLVVLL